MAKFKLMASYLILREIYSVSFVVTPSGTEPKSTENWINFLGMISNDMEIIVAHLWMV